MLGRRPRTLTRTITIGAGPEKVWDLITRIDAIAEWYDTWDRADSEGAYHSLGPGSSFRLIRRRRGRADEVALCRVTEISDARRLQWIQSSPHQPDTSVTFELLPQPGGRTELRQTRAWNAPTVRTTPRDGVIP